MTPEGFYHTEILHSYHNKSRKTMTMAGDDTPARLVFRLFDFPLYGFPAL